MGGMESLLQMHVLLFQMHALLSSVQTKFCFDNKN